MRYFLVIAILTFTGGLQAAQAGSLTAPTGRVSPSFHGKWRALNACPIYTPRVSPSVPRPAISSATSGAGAGKGKITSMRKAGGDPARKAGRN